MFYDFPGYTLKITEENILRVHVRFDQSRRVPWELEREEVFWPVKTMGLKSAGFKKVNKFNPIAAASCFLPRVGGDEFSSGRNLGGAAMEDVRATYGTIGCRFARHPPLRRRQGFGRLLNSSPPTRGRNSLQRQWD